MVYPDTSAQTPSSSSSCGRTRPSGSAVSRRDRSCRARRPARSAQHRSWQFPRGAPPETNPIRAPVPALRPAPMQRTQSATMRKVGIDPSDLSLSNAHLYLPGADARGEDTIPDGLLHKLPLPSHRGFRDYRLPQSSQKPNDPMIMNAFVPECFTWFRSSIGARSGIASLLTFPLCFREAQAGAPSEPRVGREVRA